MKWSWQKARSWQWDSNPQPSKSKRMWERNLLTAPLTLPGKVDCPTTHHTPLYYPACISWLIGFLRQWRSVMKKAVHGECLGMLSGDVWQNASVCSWKWECHNHGRGVSSTWQWLIGWGAEVIFTGSLGMFPCQQNFHLLIPERKKKNYANLTHFLFISNWMYQLTVPTKLLN